VAAVGDIRRTKTEFKGHNALCPCWIHDMTNDTDYLKQFWYAALLIRRGGNRDATMALRVVRNVAWNAPPALRGRALALLSEIAGGRYARPQR
jgi:hypothetical protein